jgi:hypothetical protein
MKKIFMLIMFGLMFLPTKFYAQDASLEQSKVESKMLEDITEDALSRARREARKAEREGYKIIGGDLPLIDQKKLAYVAKLKRDANGKPVNLVWSTECKGKNITGAQHSALEITKLEIAGLLTTNLASLTKGRLANDESTTVNEIITASKALVAKKLENVEVLYKASKEKNGDVYVALNLGYNVAEVNKIAKETAKEELMKAKLDKTEAELDAILGLGKADLIK